MPIDRLLRRAARVLQFVPGPVGVIAGAAQALLPQGRAAAPAPVMPTGVDHGFQMALRPRVPERMQAGGGLVSAVNLAAPVLPQILGAGATLPGGARYMDMPPMQAAAAGIQPAFFGAAAPAIGRGAAALGLRGAAGAVGRRMTRANAVRLARMVGPHAAAAALGIGVVELAQMMVGDAARRRRGRGITAAQMKTTRRTIRAVERLHDQIVDACRDAIPRRAPARRAACPVHAPATVTKVVRTR